MIAEHYDVHAHIQRDLLEWGWPLLSPWVSSCQNVLEVGAGTGMMTRRLVEVADRVTASDYSEAMCRHGALNVPQASWMHMDAWNISTEQRYDCIASSSFLHWAESPVSVLKQWRGVLCNEGLVMALLFTEGTAEEYYSLLGTSPVAWRSQDAWESIIGQAGFKPLLMETVRRIYSFSSMRALWQFLRKTGTLAQSETIPVGNLLRMGRVYERKYPSTDGGIRSTWVFSVIVAQRD